MRASPPKCPIAVTGAFLVALDALYWIKGGSPLLPVFGMVVLATYAIPARITTESSAWLARLFCYSIALIAAFLWSGTPMDGMIDPRRVNLLAALCAAEFVVQSWRHRPAPAVLLMVPCFIFLAASNAFDDVRVHFAAPVFLLCMALSFRGYQPHLPLRFTGMRIAAFLALCAIIIGGAVINAVVFRHSTEINNWGEQLFGVREGQTVGISTSPALGRTFGMRGSPRRVLRLAGYRGDGYLRACAFDTYDHGRWRPWMTERRLEPLPSHAQHVDTASRIRITELADPNELLFAPLNTAGVRVQAPVSWSPAYGGPLQRQSPDLLSYDVSIAKNGQESIWSAPDAAQRERMLQVPSDIDPQVRRLAAEIGDGLSGDEGKIRAVTTYLMTHHAYSLTTDPGEGDPVSNFLLQRKDAHCEYFAAASTILLRCLGVPARYVVGYYAHESAGDDTIVVRQRDAHAWAECWVEGIGWVTVDATPGNGRPDQSREQLPSWFLRQTEQFQDQIARARAWAAGLSPGQTLLLIAAIMLPYFLWQIWRSRRNRTATRACVEGYSTDPTMAALAARFQAWLARAGYPCPATHPWQAHLESVDAHPAARAFVDAYNTARFGAPDAGMIAELEKLLDALEQEIEKKDTGIPGRRRTS